MPPTLSILSRRTIPLAALSLVLVAASCFAPKSVPAEGPIADQVQASMESGTESFDHSEWDRLLAEGTEEGLVDYDHMAQNRSDLDAYLERVANANLASLDPDHLMALLMNAYNAITVRAILDHRPVDSIRDIDGVWKETTHTGGGLELTLDEIEHNVLRPFWKDPRIHFAVNCASLSCAPLPPWAFTGDGLDDQLDRRTEDFLSSPENVEIAGDALRVSKYFEWYGGDFTEEGWEPRADTIPQFIADYTRPEVESFIDQHGGDVPLELMDYDWSLNDVE